MHLKRCAGPKAARDTSLGVASKDDAITLGLFHFDLFLRFDA
jgi:hypothetical protein